MHERTRDLKRRLMGNRSLIGCCEKSLEDFRSDIRNGQEFCVDGFCMECRCIAHARAILHR